MPTFKRVRNVMRTRKTWIKRNMQYMICDGWNQLYTSIHALHTQKNSLNKLYVRYVTRLFVTRPQ